MKFVDVKNDVAFHKIFGNAQKTVSLLSFLNAVMRLEGSERIVSVTIENPYMFPPSHGGKSVVIDVRATDDLGRHFIVEMQVADKEGFEKRSQFYAARDYSAQIQQGTEYTQLRPTYFIGILNFSMTMNPNYYSQHQTIDIETGEWLLKDIQYFFIELPKFKKKLGNLLSMMDKWTFFIKNAENLRVIPSDVTDEGLRSAYEEADRHSWSKVEINAYYDAGVRETDQIQERIKAEKLGREKGMKEGREKGMKEGREKGRKEGKEEAKKETILGFHKIGVPIEKIAEGIGETTEYIKNIIDNAIL